MSKKNIIFGASILCLIGLIASMIQIYKVNAAYPKAKQVYIPAKQTAQLKEGINLKVMSSKWLTNEEIKVKYGQYMVLETNTETKALTAMVEVQNTTEQELKVPLYTIYIESDAHYCNGLDLEMYMIDNLNQPAEINLKPNEKVTVNLTYSMFGTQFKKEQWNNIDGEKFFLVDDRYPVKYCWELK